MQVTRLFSKVGITKATARLPKQHTKERPRKVKNKRQKVHCTPLHGYSRGISFLKTSTLSTECPFSCWLSTAHGVVQIFSVASYIPTSKRKKGPGSLCEWVKIAPSSVFDLLHTRSLNLVNAPLTLGETSFFDNGLFKRAHTQSWGYLRTFGFSVITYLTHSTSLQTLSEAQQWKVGHYL